MPDQFRRYTLSTLSDRSKEIDKATHAAKMGKWLFFTGSPGTGKTHFGCGVLRMLAQEMSQMKVPPINGSITPDIRLRLVSSCEFFLEIKESYGSDRNGEKEVLGRYSHGTDVLLLDDVGAEKVSEWSRQLFYLLIDRRYRGCLQTIITSNLSLAQMSAMMDDRIASRIAETGVVIDLGKKDWRVTHHA